MNIKDVTLTYFPVVKCPECGEEMTGREVVRAIIDDVKGLCRYTECTDCKTLLRMNFELLEED